jgi:integrase
MAYGRTSIYPYTSKAGIVTYRAQVSVTIDGKRELIRKTFATEKEAIEFVTTAKGIPDLPRVLKETRTLADVRRELERQGRHWHVRHRDYIVRVCEDIPHPLTEITIGVLNDYKIKCLDDGNAPTTINKKLTNAKMLLNEAERMGWIERNPARQVTRLREPQGRDRVLSAEERARLLTACQASKTKGLYALVVMALCTAARKGELLALAWKDVDRENGRVVFRHTKNGKPRGLMLPKEVIAMLPKSKHLVFEGLGDFKKAWMNALDRADIRGFRFHDLRHTAISELVRQGLSMPQIMAISGHLTTQMCKRYQHHDVADTAAPLAALAAAMSHDR